MERNTTTLEAEQEILLIHEVMKIMMMMMFCVMNWRITASDFQQSVPTLEPELSSLAHAAEYYEVFYKKLAP
jgi:hypothetical protein